MKLTRVKLNNIIASGLGSSFEWYDFALYGFFAPLLAKNFFSNSSSCALLNTFSFFAIGFASRPLGAIIFGYLGDKYGRVKCLQITPLVMTIPSIIIATTPTYKIIGIASPVILLISRIVQGVCMGGEYAGNIIYLCEAHIKRQYFLGSIGSCSASFGILLASIITTLLYKTLSQQILLLYGWRIAFFMAIIFGLSANEMRKNLNETPTYQYINLSNQISLKPISEAIKHDWKRLLLAIGILYIHATSFYFTFMFIPAFITKFLGKISSLVFLHNSIFLMSRIAVIPIIGFIADKYGGKNILILSCILILLTTIWLCSSIATSHINSIYLIIGTLAFLTAINAGVIPGILIEITLTKTRYTILSLAFNLCFGIFGGLTPYLSLLLIKYTGYKIIPEYYLAFSACTTLVISFFIKEKSLNLEKNCGKI